MFTPARHLAVFWLAAPLWAQSLFTTPYTGPGFEVASVKPANPAERTIGIPPTQGGRFQAVNVTARDLLGYSFHTTSAARTSGGPAWLDSERFDIVAKAEGSPPESEVRPMVLQLLENRFALTYRRETKQMSAYVLTVAKGGLKVTLSDACKLDPEQKFPCGGFRVYKRSYVGGQGVSTSDLTEVLEALLGDPVIDGTGITGLFSMTLQWTPDDFQQKGTDATDAGANPDERSLFSAIQDQLGMKLERRKIPVDVIVVTSARKPSAN